MPSNSSEGTNRFECPHCGRSFNSSGEFRQHEIECGAAKQSGNPVAETHAKTDTERDPDREWVSTP